MEKNPSSRRGVAAAAAAAAFNKSLTCSGEGEEAGGMKRSGSEWDLDAFLRPEAEAAGNIIDNHLPLLRAAHKPTTTAAGFDATQDLPPPFHFANDHREAISSGHSAITGGGGGSHPIWSSPQNLAATPAIESQSSICAGSPTPTSSLKPKSIDNQATTEGGGTSGSDQSDDESLELEAASCEQTGSVIDLKRMRRMVSNRESARRSRKRKQAHLADLELQVDQLRGENASLYKQFTDANQTFTEAVTDNRVLKSDVEAMRAKVKLAEDLVTRGSTCSLDHLLQGHIGSTTHLLNTRSLCRASEVPPIVDFQSNDPACYIGASAAGQVQNVGVVNDDNKDGNSRVRLNQCSPLQSIASLDLQNRLSGEVTSCGNDIWPWDSHTTVMPKQL